MVNDSGPDNSFLREASRSRWKLVEVDILGDGLVTNTDRYGCCCYENYDGIPIRPFKMYKVIRLSKLTK